ncbi:MAG: UDP-4-amino-4,6-dideoxy-N-acetyl-beta-L-altrosamine transaminase [Geobacteraceae bacterium GWC2_55_20]|nr:MAG: UDP-4-amino-4,6-dideoxy-N-acetyl-beta-L-altrosamine transaminase [Geobacteraceae bacterium GWC2_55_20]OGU19210.1 MAG: UDP-4-amino-4,6-dideoxy-N-acetyl-beta-L-altrosamine transaminase [Geobacteraceae bacterium GWF2_54_21]HBA72623.1 UDP-4-amino-4,6-dideoxy-N-acetyl-beta-L-altrosamine transaminase [Geobacter sp.]HCE66659.1 UDP-4-amino-4,6-dideoxy-N-acetyl-beta-L-altrosamine transaminase [Geobacter sp.]
MRTTFLPFSTPTLEDAEINEVVDSLRSGWITTGPKVKRFEEAFKAYVGAPYAVPLTSATAGLHLTLLALGIKEGDEIITTPMTFASTVSMIILCGGTPVLADIEPGTLNIDVERVREKITPRTRAVIPVHFAGQSCDMDPLFAIAREHGLTVIEDAAHAVGTEYKGQRIGSLNSISIFSFHPNKNITTGEGGMVCTADENLAEEISLMKFHGMNREAWKRFAASGTPNYDIMMPGFKYNMMDIQAAIGIHQLPRLDGFIDRRKEIAEFYNREFSDLPELALPAYAPYQQRHAWHLYTPLVRIEKLNIDRDRFMEELKKHNIGSGLHYKAIHHHAWYREHMPVADEALPNASYASQRILSLPLFPKMTDEDARDVVTAVKDVICANRR